jgi:tetratricopeptide (TPR) repeat protein
MSDRLDDLKARIAALEEQKRLPDIVPLQREYAELTGEECGTESALYVAALNELGSLLRALKQLDESEEAFLKAAGIEGRVRGTAGNADYATCINNLAGTYRLMGEFEKAEALFGESMDIYAQTVGTEHFVYLSALNNLGLVYQDLKRYDDARALHEQALAVLQKQGKRDTAYATTLNNLASVAMATGRYHDAEGFLAETLELWGQTAGKDTVLYLTGLNNLAAVSFMAGDYPEAETYFAEALAMIERVLGTEHPDYARTAKNLDRTREKLAQAAGDRPEGGAAGAR